MPDLQSYLEIMTVQIRPANGILILVRAKRVRVVLADTEAGVSLQNGRYEPHQHATSS